MPFFKSRPPSRTTRRFRCCSSRFRFDDDRRSRVRVRPCPTPPSPLRRKARGPIKTGESLIIPGLKMGGRSVLPGNAARMGPRVHWRACRWQVRGTDCRRTRTAGERKEAGQSPARCMSGSPIRPFRSLMSSNCRALPIYTPSRLSGLHGTVRPRSHQKCGMQ